MRTLAKAKDLIRNWLYREAKAKDWMKELDDKVKEVERTLAKQKDVVRFAGLVERDPASVEGNVGLVLAALKEGRKKEAGERFAAAAGEPARLGRLLLREEGEPRRLARSAAAVAELVTGASGTSCWRWLATTTRRLWPTPTAVS